MGEFGTKLTDVVTPPPAAPTTPFFPSGNHPTTTEIDQMINSRIHQAVETLRYEASVKQQHKNLAKVVGIGVGGFALGVGGTMLVGRIVRGRRARAAASGR